MFVTMDAQRSVDEYGDVMIIPWDEELRGRGVSVYCGMYVHEVSLIQAH